MPIYVFTLLFTAISSLVLGFYIWLKNKKIAVNIVFLLLCLFIAIWSLALFLLYVAKDPKLINAMPRMAHANALFIPIIWLHLVLLLTDRLKQKRYLLVLFYIVIFIFALLVLLTDLFIISANTIFDINRYAVGTNLYYYYMLLFAIPIVYGLYVLIKTITAAQGIKKKQLVFFCLASIMNFILGFSTMFYILNINIFPLGLYLTWLFAPLIAYAVYRYKLFDISVVIKRSIVFTILLLIVTSLYGAAIYASHKIIPLKIIQNRWLWAFVASLVIAVSLDPLQRLLERLTDKIFFKKSYDYEITLEQTAAALATIIKMDDLYNFLKEFFNQTIKTINFSLFVFDEYSGNFIEKTTEQNIINAKLRSYSKNNELILHLTFSQIVVLYHELEDKIKFASKNDADLERNKQIKSELDRFGWAAVIPLLAKDKLVGLIALGAKKSQDAFTSTDLRLLSTLASQTAVAVENASIYEKEKQLSDSKSELISVASHRLRTPLSVIKWALSLLDEDKADFSSRQRELIDRALLSNANMIKLANDLLDVSRIEEKKVVQQLSVFSLENLVDQIISELQERFATKEIIMDFTKPEIKLPQIKADYDRLKLAIYHIVQNALDYSPKQGQLFINLKLEQDKFLLLTVKDTGIGIPRIEHEQVFNKFYRSERAVALNTEGSGLGLFIAKSVIEELGGSIWFESKANQGTTFFVKLNIYQP